MLIGLIKAGTDFSIAISNVRKLNSSTIEIQKKKKSKKVKKKKKKKKKKKNVKLNEMNKNVALKYPGFCTLHPTRWSFPIFQLYIK